MDPKTTGSFISLLRKEKNMTQKQLAEKINVSDKAISRWETGRGYPDIESLEALSNSFSVSINELLYGKRIEAPVTAQSAEKDIAGAYIDTAAKKRHIRNIAICLAVILAFITALFSLTAAIVYEKVMGSPNCVIASDYSYMTLFGERYVPLALENTECALSNCLISEAQVEGTPFIGKLLFGEAVYSVKQCQGNDIVYLQTDYDLVVSKYYCRESKADEYREISRNTAYDRLTAEILTKDWNTYDLELNDALTQMLTGSSYTDSVENCSWSRGDGDESIIVYSSQTSGPFRREEGELIRKHGEYYWFDYNDIPEDQNNGDYSMIKAHGIDDSYNEDMDVLFSYMFK